MASWRGKPRDSVMSTSSGPILPTSGPMAAQPARSPLAPPSPTHPGGTANGNDSPYTGMAHPVDAYSSISPQPPPKSDPTAHSENGMLGGSTSRPPLSSPAPSPLPAPEFTNQHATLSHGHDQAHEDVSRHLASPSSAAGMTADRGIAPSTAQSHAPSSGNTHDMRASHVGIPYTNQQPGQYPVQYGLPPPPGALQPQMGYQQYGYPQDGAAAYGGAFPPRVTKVVGGPESGVGIRYGFMAVHFALLVTITVLTGYYFRDIILLSIHCAMALAFLIYVPAAFGLTVARQTNHFDHAGGETAYLVIQQAGWFAKHVIQGLLQVVARNGLTAIASGGLTAFYLSVVDCEARRRIVRNGIVTIIQANLERCRVITAITALSFIHALTLMAWMIFVIVAVYKADPMYPDRAFQISTGWLLRGWRPAQGH